MKEINSLKELPPLQQNDICLLFLEEVSGISLLDTAVISLDEQNYINSFVQESDKHIKAIGKSFTRIVLSHLSTIPPKEITIERNEFGKPLGTQAALPYFNLSDSKNAVLFGVSKAMIGVDIEWINPHFQYKEVAEEIFSAEEQLAIQANADPNSEFYLRWTVKEAVNKAAGKGLGNRIPTNQYTTQALVMNGYAIAVASPLEQFELQFFKYLATKI